MHSRMSRMTLLLYLSLVFVGCGPGGTVAPSDSDLSRYVEENTDAIAQQEAIDRMENENDSKSGVAK
ncbi:hypothetical protein Pla100_03230 [Neorhodopirellula pilleata]|uniref:Uncharacterized protein n=1 Tax=Neorhodopirellula pilleata TaxID=2714738 RepID=A0A5C6AWJ2_9BACT|nr:hypothetical protein Pla100_03230 [Neorhodopirellula pilleata]